MSDILLPEEKEIITDQEQIEVYKQLIDIYWDNPVWFAEDMLNFQPDPWQADVMMGIAEEDKVSVRSGQGVGRKTTPVASIPFVVACP